MRCFVSTALLLGRSRSNLKRRGALHLLDTIIKGNLADDMNWTCAFCEFATIKVINT